MLAHAIVGMAEATSRRLTNDDAEDDPDRLAGWLAEMAWFGLRGVRAEEPAEHLYRDAGHPTSTFCTLRTVAGASGIR